MQSSDDPPGGPRLTRRQLEQLGLSAGLWMLAGCNDPESKLPQPIEVVCGTGTGTEGVYDYVIVGSGAAGGTLAGNLARRGFSVILLEAGSDPPSWVRDVPALHAESVEDPNMRWDFFVRRYESEGQEQQSDKYVPARRGVLYPRAGTLGGCTAHNALITIYPHEKDWNEIAETFSDASFRGENMRKYFERIEHCDYAERPRLGEPNPARHGFDGWLHTATADPWLAAGDKQLISIVEAAIEEVSTANPNVWIDAARMALSPSRSLWDPNDYRAVKRAPEGVVFVPLHMNHGTRVGTREYVKAVASECPTHLHLELDALATKVLFEDGNRAVGIEYLKGASLYSASPSPNTAPDAGVRKFVKARREVILCGGVFNSPQLLLLSGIGDKEALAALGIESVVDLPGVGKNLQDRYEIGVVSEMAEDFAVIEGARLVAPDPGHPDPALEKWWFERTGPYATNGVVSAIIKKSHKKLEVPDLFLFGLVGRFQGYKAGFSSELVKDHRHFTWGVLKGHTKNRAGVVRLRSADPRDTPDIRFRYFEEGSPGYEEDLHAMVEGVETVRRIMAGLGSMVTAEVAPGPGVRTRAEIARYVRDNSWGHHASCSNKMGPRTDPLAVVDEKFRVHGTKNLRVVDASVFPKIPGFFIVTSVFMIAEKATDDLVAAARST